MRSRVLPFAAALTFPAGVVALVWPHLDVDQKTAAGLLFIAIVIAALVAISLFLGLAYIPVVYRREPLVIDQGTRELSIRMVLIALGAGLGPTGAIAAISVPVTAVAILLVIATASQSRILSSRS